MKHVKLGTGFTIILLFLFTFGIYAAPYQGYIYNSRNEAVLAPQAYLPAMVIKGDDLGVGQLREPRDIAIGNQGYIYIADTGNDRVICINQEWQLLYIIDQFEVDGTIDHLRSPTGLFVTDTGELYVADRDNARIIYFDPSGKYLGQIGAPSDEAFRIDQSSRYRPTKVAVDPLGRIYVIAEGIYDGLAEFDSDGKFKGFIGAPRVRPSLAEIFWRRFATEEQRQKMTLFLPVEYQNIDVDAQGFIFSVEAGDAHESSIKRLVASGSDVLVRNGYAPPMGDLIGDSSRFNDVVARENGIYSVLDRRSGRVFTYDINGNLLYVFGALGEAFGALRQPVAIDTIDEKVLVLDLGTNSITVFQPTTYAQLIHQAIDLYEDGKLSESVQAWEQVLRHNVNFDFAYVAVGRSYLSQGRYPEAMRYFKLGSNRELYSSAYRYYRKDIIEQNFGVIMISIGLVIGAISLGRKFYNRSKQTKRWLHVQSTTRLGKMIDSIKYAYYIIFHPFDGFWDLKHEKRGNVFSASFILVLVVATYAFMRQYTGYIFNTRNATDLNIYIDIGSVLLPFMLWSLVNWALTTLMDGKGTFKEIYITSAYALTPIILINIPMTIISNYLIMPEGTFLYLMITISMIWSVLLLCAGTQVLHEYDVMKTVLAILLIILGIGSILFLGLIFLDVVNLLLGFVTTIYAELVFRV